MRERNWPVGDPIGRRLKNGDYGSEEPWLTVVGVVEDVKDQGLHAAAPPIWYLPFAQQTARTFTLVLRTAVEPGAVAAAVRSEIAALDRALPVYDVATIEEVVSRSLAQPRFSAVLSGLFSTLGLLLTAVGLYGVLSYTVNRSRHEIGVRMALGARARDVAALFLRRGMLLVLCGLGLGAAGALALTRLISGLLYGVGPADPASFAGIGVVLAAVALLAIYPPARRAARVHPAITLKEE
jgi:putative ABC transport system permease protein